MVNKKGLDFKHKEVISICDGKRLGFVQDVTADFKTGTISEIIVPGNNKIFNLFTKYQCPAHIAQRNGRNWDANLPFVAG